MCMTDNRVTQPAFGEALFDLVRRTSTELPADVEAALKQAHDNEAPGSTARTILAAFLENIRLAREKRVPLCQDTGMPLFFIHHPPGLSHRAMRKACEGAVVRATQEEFLRHNAVDSVTGVRNGKFQLVDSGDAEID